MTASRSTTIRRALAGRAKARQHERMTLILLVLFPVAAIAWTAGSVARADAAVVLLSKAQWKQATARAERVTVSQQGLTLAQAPQGLWTSRWFDAPCGASWKSVAVETEIDLFANKTIEVVVDGSTKPFVDADGVEHDWYGRCMIAILDAKRWMMAIRSGTNHIQWGKRDAIHVLTSGDEGRTWNKLNHWFDGTPIKGTALRRRAHAQRAGAVPHAQR